MDFYADFYIDFVVPDAVKAILKPASAKYADTGSSIRIT